MKKICIAILVGLVCAWAMCASAHAVSMSALTESQCEMYLARCNFTPTERSVFECRAKDKSIIATARETAMSEAAVNRRIKNIKRKMAMVDNEKKPIGT